MCLVCLETISVMKDFHLSRHYNYYNCPEVIIMLVGFEYIALNVGPLSFCFVTSLNDDVYEPFAPIKILTNHVAV